MCITVVIQISNFEEIWTPVFEPQELLRNSLLPPQNPLPLHHELTKSGAESPKSGLLHDKYNVVISDLIWFSTNYAVLTGYILFLY